MSLYNALYEREGHGISPNEPEKKGFARFLPDGRPRPRSAARHKPDRLRALSACRAGGLAGRDPVFLPVTVVCSLRSPVCWSALPWCCWQIAPCAACRTTPPSGCPGQNRPLPPTGNLPAALAALAHWCWGCCALYRPLCLRSPHSRGTTPGLPCWYFWRWIFWCWRFSAPCAPLYCRCKPRTACCAARADCCLTHRFAAWRQVS